MRCSHTKFTKMFADMKVVSKNSLMPSTNLLGTTLEMITKVFDKADKYYALYLISIR